MTIETRLAEIRARAENATEGPCTALGSGVASGDHWHVVASGEAVAHISSRDGVNEDQREPDAEFIAASRTDLPALLAAVEAVMELHRDVGIYDECLCENPSPEDGLHKRIEDVGVTCNFLYVVCRECCMEDGYQKEECAHYCDHDPLGSNCSTVRAITAALEVQG